MIYFSRYPMHFSYIRFRNYSPFVTGHIYFSSDLWYHIYTIPFIPLSFGPYFSQIFQCLVLHIIVHLHISFYYVHCSFLLFQHIICPQPSFPHQRHSIHTPKAHGSLFLLSHTHKDHHHMSILFL